jgi:hypothetical protein
MAAVNSGWRTASGTTYFFDFTKASTTPLMERLRGITPGTWGITNVENARLG